VLSKYPVYYMTYRAEFVK